MDKLILIGAGGHSKVIQDIANASNEFETFAVVDDAIDGTNQTDGIIYANTSFIDSLQVEHFKFCIAIGNNATRREIFATLGIPIEQYAVLIHPTAVVSKSAEIGNGTVVMPNAVVNADSIIGKHCIVNTAAVVEHDNRMEDYVHISPNVTLSGIVSIGEGTHVGSGATVIPGKIIGCWCTIGAGAVVVGNIGKHVTAAGVPAKKIVKN
ncbi:acetyltransferase [Virgibacillus sediminis]|uniref:Acetyltransferase n=1 Tax=Virgibacillus sediminis TaxID=202260 RepID=A0ABV7A4J4_9BACI